MSKINVSIITSLLSLIFLFSSCNNDDDSNDTDFPVKLVLREQTDLITFFKNGEEIVPSSEEENVFYENTSEKLTEFKNIIDTQFYEFIDDKLLTTNSFSDGEESTVSYNFTDSVLNVLDTNDVNVPIANGSIKEVKKTLIIVYYEEGNSSSITSALGLLEDDEIFPLTFESTKGFYHDFENLEDITENDKLYLFTREYIFKE